MALHRYFEANRANWDDRARIDLASEGYDIARFLAEPDSLTPTVTFDRTELGDVGGKALLHLQCHIGNDTLAWARLGATVTGIDFSARSIEAARSLSLRSGIPGKFVVSDIYDLPTALEQRFDVVYTGCGALCWLPDVARWARIVARYVRPGGTFYMRDGHPLLWSADSDRADGQIVLVHPYSTPDPVRFDRGGRYSKPNRELRHTVTYEWNHGVGEVVTALIDAGLVIEFVREYTFCDWPALPGMVRSSDGLWRLPETSDHLPLTYSVRAQQP